MSQQNTKLIYTLGLVFIFNFIGYTCNVMATKILTANLSMSLYGDFAVAWRSLALIAQIVTFGSALTATRFISEYAQEKSGEKRRGFIVWNIKLVLRSFMMLSIVYCLFWGVAWITHLSDLHQFEVYHMASAVAIFALLLSLFTLFNNYVLASGYTTLSSFLSTVGFYGIKLLVIACGFYFFAPTTELHISTLMIAVVFLLFAIGGLTYSLLPENELLNSVGSILSGNQKTESNKTFLDHKWMSISRGSVLNSFCATLSGTVGIFILEIFSPNEHLVAVYNISLIATGFIMLIMGSMNRLFSAEVTVIDTMNEEKKSRLQHSLDAIGSCRLLLLFLSVLLFSKFHVEILNFFNISEHQYTWVMPLMLLRIYFNNSCVLRSRYLQTSGYSNFCFRVRLLRLFIVVVGGIILTYYFDIYGVVISNLISTLIKLIFFTYKCRQLTTVRFNRLF